MWIVEGSSLVTWQEQLQTTRLSLPNNVSSVEQGASRSECPYRPSFSVAKGLN